MPRRRLSHWCVTLFCSFLCAACAAPPTQEMDQAQGAIDAARAAGADRYAADEYDAAVRALASARDAVALRDYRLALNHALDSRERAQQAAREAATEQALQRSAAERRLGEVAALLDRAEQTLAAAVTARVSRAALASARAAIDAAEGPLQKAGTAIQEGEYAASQKGLAESAQLLERAIAEIETAMAARKKRS